MFAILNTIVQHIQTINGIQYNLNTYFVGIEDDEEEHTEH